MSDQQDRIYATAHQQVTRFSFDDTVVRVFPDMIRRSVPGYPTIIDMIGVLAARYAQPDTCLYDLGCSLGAATTAMATLTADQGNRLIAVDNSAAMIRQASTLIAQTGQSERVSLLEGDVASMDFEPCSMAVLNFTLQFIAPDKRDALIQRLATLPSLAGFWCCRKRSALPMMRRMPCRPSCTMPSSVTMVIRIWRSARNAPRWKTC